MSKSQQISDFQSKRRFIPGTVKANIPGQAKADNPTLRQVSQTAQRTTGNLKNEDYERECRMQCATVTDSNREICYQKCMEKYVKNARI